MTTDREVLTEIRQRVDRQCPFGGAPDPTQKDVAQILKDRLGWDMEILDDEEFQAEQECERFRTLFHSAEDKLTRIRSRKMADKVLNRVDQLTSNTLAEVNAAREASTNG